MFAKGHLPNPSPPPGGCEVRGCSMHDVDHDHNAGPRRDVYHGYAASDDPHYHDVQQQQVPEVRGLLLQEPRINEPSKKIEVVLVQLSAQHKPEQHRLSWHIEIRCQR